MRINQQTMGEGCMWATITLGLIGMIGITLGILQLIHGKTTNLSTVDEILLQCAAPYSRCELPPHQNKNTNMFQPDECHNSWDCCNIQDQKEIPKPTAASVATDWLSVIANIPIVSEGLPNRTTQHHDERDFDCRTSMIPYLFGLLSSGLALFGAVQNHHTHRCCQTISFTFSTTQKSTKRRRPRETSQIVADR